VGPLLTTEAVIPLLAEALEAPINSGTTTHKGSSDPTVAGGLGGPQQQWDHYSQGKQ
jgi:hypothetical protein